MLHKHTLAAAAILLAAAQAGCAGPVAQPAETGKLVETKEQFEKELEEAGDKLVLAFFSSTWSSPSTFFTPVVEQIAENTKEDSLLLKVDFDDLDEVAEKYEVKSVPACVLIRNKQVVGRTKGSDRNGLVSLVHRELPQYKDLSLDSARPMEEPLPSVELGARKVAEHMHRIKSLDEFREKLAAGDKLLLVAFTDFSDRKYKFLENLLEYLASAYGKKLAVLEVETGLEEVARVCGVAGSGGLRGLARERTFVFMRNQRLLGRPLKGKMYDNAFLRTIEKQLKARINKHLSPNRSIRSKLVGWIQGKPRSITEQMDADLTAMTMTSDDRQAKQSSVKR